MIMSWHGSLPRGASRSARGAACVCRQRLRVHQIKKSMRIVAIYLLDFSRSKATHGGISYGWFTSFRLGQDDVQYRSPLLGCGAWIGWMDGPIGHRA